MTIYAVGDIQGCYDPLARLLEKVKFDQSVDQLLCVGDLVNRGPDSLKVLRLLKSLENQCISVLGNHDIHLLSMVFGVREPRSGDTLLPVLNAPDLPELCMWLRQRPLLAHFPQNRTLLCHAGIYPWWTLQQALDYSNEISQQFASEKSCVKLLKRIYSNSPSKWRGDLGKTRRRRFIINAFTRMRFCSPTGHLNLTESGFVSKTRKNRLPWFEIENPSLVDYRVIFGHWSALGFLNKPNHLCLDTGYVWGRHMTFAEIPKSPSGEPLDKKRIIITTNS